MTEEQNTTPPWDEGITTCVIHSFDDGTQRPYEEDCEHCFNEHGQRQEVMAGLVDANNEGVMRLQQQGWQDPFMPLAVRIDVLVNFIMAGNGRMRQSFECMYHMQIAEILKQVEENVNRAKLTQGVQSGLPNNLKIK